jgi:RNA polymerase sigma-70 factor, ECF subfamily
LRSSDAPPAACDDKELASRVCAGETHLFAELVRRHQDSVYGMAFRILRSRTDAEDAAQEAFLHAFRGLQGFQGTSRFSTWLYRITFNLCTDSLRKRRRFDPACPCAPQADQATDSRTDLETALQAAEERAAVRATVHRLPEIYRTAIILHYYQGMSREEMAAVTGLPLRTIETRLYRARQLLRKDLEKVQGLPTV